MERFFKTDKLNVEATRYGCLRRGVARNAPTINDGATRRIATSRRDNTLLTVDFSLRGRDSGGDGSGRPRRDAINRVSTPSTGISYPSRHSDESQNRQGRNGKKKIAGQARNDGKTGK